MHSLHFNAIADKVDQDVDNSMDYTVTATLGGSFKLTYKQDSSNPRLTLNKQFHTGNPKFRQTIGKEAFEMVAEWSCKKTCNTSFKERGGKFFKSCIFTSLKI